MLIQVEEFRERVELDLNNFIDELKEEIGFVGDSQRLAWSNSLVKVSQVLANERLKDFHLHLGQSGSLSVEYRLPASSSRTDVVLLGRDDRDPIAMFIELKDWDTSSIREGDSENLINYRGQSVLHPSDQVKGYTEYCQKFHSAVLDYSAKAYGCVFFTKDADVSVLRSGVHEDIASQYPVFTARREELNTKFPEYLSDKLHYPDEDFAVKFENGYYKQDRNFVLQISKNILDKKKSPFVLLDNQRKGFELSKQAIEETLENDLSKCVIIIEGPPGSGKSVLAAQLWAYLAKNYELKGESIVITTTSGCQKNNWESLFEKVSGKKAGRGIIVGANQYNPGLSPKWVGEMREQYGYEVDVDDWQNNLKLYEEKNSRLKLADDEIGLAIVDEAHALIDPTTEGARGVSPSGWSMHAGPQAYHIMRGAKISIFLMDTKQSYRDNETTTKENIKKYADMQGIGRIDEISLEDAQFRCGGSKEYLDWVENFLSKEPQKYPVHTWRKTQNNKGPFLFEIVKDPLELEAKLREKYENNKSSVRLVASYGRPWKTKDINDPHNIDPEDMDFHISYTRDGHKKYWSKIWNYAPKMDYKMFVQAPSGTRMHEDPLCEVGCPYVVRGFDYDYLGLLWLKDLVWRSNAWKVNLDYVHESAWKKTVGGAKKGGTEGEKARKQLIDKLFRGYRILLSRAIKGIYVWFEDEETEEFVKSFL